MEIYIEKAFIDDFYLSLNNIPTREEECLLSVLSKYGDVEKYVDVKIESAQILEGLKEDNPIFSSLFDVGSIFQMDSNLFFNHIQNSKSPSPKLVFCVNEEIWFDDAQKFGCICLSFGTYKKKIKSFLDCHLELAFFMENFDGWHSLKPLSTFPNKVIFLNDNYILTDVSGQKIKDNLIPIFRNILNANCSSKSHIFTEEFKVKPDNTEKREEKAIAVYKRLKEDLSNINCEFVIYYKKRMPLPSIVLHGRTIISNYFKIYSPKGLNLIPFKKSNEIFRVMTIFDKRTYMELKVELEVYGEWLNKLNSGSWSSSEFVNYPSDE